MKKLLILTLLLCGCAGQPIVVGTHVFNKPEPVKVQQKPVPEYMKPPVIDYGKCSKATGSVYPNGENAPVCAVTGLDIRDNAEWKQCGRVSHLITTYVMNGQEVPKELLPKVEYCKKLQKRLFNE
ncbi:hypothetical protein [Klebsiella aerogenes]|uniref:hypothetical protein n=1 Tax=Klebsiella aerogenes TaxID=548 RepID=UPI001BCF6A65|nr:hypothetical protein [Klebsiella aerogenes]